MYTVYQVVVHGEDGEYVLADWQSIEKATQEAKKAQEHYGDGQYVFVRPLTREF